jgi:hypothetical protein
VIHPAHKPQNTYIPKNGKNGLVCEWNDFLFQEITDPWSSKGPVKGCAAF